MELITCVIDGVPEGARQLMSKEVRKGAFSATSLQVSCQAPTDLHFQARGKQRNDPEPCTSLGYET